MRGRPAREWAPGAHPSSLGSVVTVMKDAASSMASKYSVSSSSSLSSALLVKRLPRDAGLPASPSPGSPHSRCLRSIPRSLQSLPQLFCGKQRRGKLFANPKASWGPGPLLSSSLGSQNFKDFVSNIIGKQKMTLSWKYPAELTRNSLSG